MGSSSWRSPGTATGSIGHRSASPPRRRGRDPVTPDELDALTRRPGPGPHRSLITLDGDAVETLADLPPLRNRLLFIGLNPSPVSVVAGHYHQGRLGRTFWRRLMLAGNPSAGHGDRDGRRCPAGCRSRHHRPAQAPDASRRGHGRRADRGCRPALAEDRAVAAGRGRVHLQAGGVDLGRPRRWSSPGASSGEWRSPAGPAF